MEPIDVESLYILGVRVDDVTYEEMLEAIDRFIAQGGHHQLVTVNPEFVVTAQDDEEFRRVLNGAALCLPDGVGLLWAARLLGRPLRERVTGSDGIYRIAEHAARRGYHLFLLGAAPGVAKQAAAVLTARYPGLVISGTHAGSPTPEEEEEICARVQAARPDILLVAYGHPQQDKWIARNQARCGVPVAIGVGGAFDFVAGVVPRAPRWMRRWGLEWLYRLLRQPWRWRRQLALPRFVFLVLRAWVSGSH